MGGYVSLPISGGSTISPEWVSSHLLQSSHQEPSCSLAFSSQAAEVSKAPPFSVAQYRPLPLDGGLIMPAIWPELARVKRVVPFASLEIFHAEAQGTMWSLSAPTA